LDNLFIFTTLSLTKVAVKLIHALSSDTRSIYACAVFDSMEQTNEWEMD